MVFLLHEQSALITIKVLNGCLGGVGAPLGVIPPQLIRKRLWTGMLCHLLLFGNYCLQEDGYLLSLGLVWLSLFGLRHQKTPES